MTNLSTNLRRGVAIALSAATILSMGVVSSQAGSVTGGFGPAKEIKICVKKHHHHHNYQDVALALQSSENGYGKHRRFVLKTVLWRDRDDFYSVPKWLCYRRHGGYGS